MNIRLTHFGLLAPLLVVVSAQAGCDTTIEPITGAPSQTATLPAPDGATDGPWGTCTTDSPDDWAPIVCPDKGADGGALECEMDLETRTRDDGTKWCSMTAVCNYPCQVATDCPEPTSGTVEPSCTGSNCYLLCDSTHVCPDGMTCTRASGTVDPSQAYCMWKYDCEGLP